jgi:hypothetical protein
VLFTDVELEYLNTQRLARIATVSAKGEPDVAAVGFRVDGDQVVVGGLDNTKTRKYWNVKGTGRASLVVDHDRHGRPGQADDPHPARDRVELRARRRRTAWLRADEASGRLSRLSRLSQLGLRARGCSA